MMPVKLDLTAQLFIILHCPGLSLLTFTTLKGHEVKFYSQI